jgi:hypothetical protein
MRLLYLRVVKNTFLKNILVVILSEMMCLQGLSSKFHVLYL